MTTSAHSIVMAARDGSKTDSWFLINGVVENFHELHGDRQHGDDAAIIGGVGRINGLPVTVIATQKGTSMDERLATHFGSPEPWGYRKASRLMEQAAQFHHPVVLFVNTPGAYPGPEAEAAGQGAAIAQSLLMMQTLAVPCVTLIFGEGGSGGALALASGDRVWMTEKSEYAVLSPEGFATILWKDATRAAEAADVMQLTPQQLLKQHVIERIIPEPLVMAKLKDDLYRELRELMRLPVDELLEKRQQRFRQF